MIAYLGLGEYSGSLLLLLALGVCIAGMVTGYITDAVMGDRGFGPFGNGMLTVLGAAVGLYVRHTFFGRMSPGDVATTAIFAAAAATLLLLVLGVAKHWVQD